MTYPRAHLVDAENGGYYHVFSRCVQQQWLCGTDTVSGRSYEHRKQWIEDRLCKLASIFAVDLYAYAVMSNHYHVVLEVKPQQARSWPDREVAERWCALGRSGAPKNLEVRIVQLLDNPGRLAVVRERLGNLSWLMAALNEYIARRANRESGAKGRFWQGRFESKRLLDETAVLACMAYVDLNPIRANIVEQPSEAPHTSIRRRVWQPDKARSILVPLRVIGLNLEAYRELLQWTASVENGSIVPPAPSTALTLSRVQQEPSAWLSCVKAHRFKYRAYGALHLLREYAQSLGQRWLCGAKAGLAAP